MSHSVHAINSGTTPQCLSRSIPGPPQTSTAPSRITALLPSAAPQAELSLCRAGSTFKYAPPPPTPGKPGAEAPLRSVATDGATPTLKGMSAAGLADLTRAMLDGPGRVDALMGIFGLARAKDTNVGNRMFRGISGGERKRLSTVELLAGPQRVLVLDEISTGACRPPPHARHVPSVLLMPC